MILEAIIEAFAGAIRGLLSLLPEWEPPSELMESGGETIGNAAAQLNGYFPVAVLGTVVVALVAFRVGVTVWRFAKTVWDMLPLT